MSPDGSLKRCMLLESICTGMTAMRVPKFTMTGALVLAITVAAMGSVSHAATLEQAVFQENLFAEDLFHQFGTNDYLPEHFSAANTTADVTGSGSVRTTGGALPRAEGELTYTATSNQATSMFGKFEARVYYEWTVERVGPL